MKNLTRSLSHCYSIVLSLTILLSVSLTCIDTYAQGYDGIGNSSVYKIYSSSGGFYYGNITDSNYNLDQFVYLKAGENLEIQYKKNNTGTIAAKYYIYSPIGLEDSFQFSSSVNSITRNYVDIPEAKEGIWIIRNKKITTAVLESGYAYYAKVTNAANVIQSGRLYVWRLPILSSTAITFNIFTTSKYGFKYQTTYYGFRPINCNIQSSPVGIMEEGSCLTLYKSVPYYTGMTYHLGEACVQRNKIFFSNVPDSLPEMAPMYDYVNDTTVLEWFNPSIIYPTISNAAFTSSDSTPYAGLISFEVENFEGNAYLFIDLNNNGDYTDSNDRVVPIIISEGINTVSFDGKDNYGNDLACGTIVKYKIKIEKGGEHHIILADVEGLTGVKQQRLTGPGLPDYTMSWNDSAIFDSGRSGNNSAIVGNNVNTNLPTGIHGWSYSNSATGWGNNSYIDNWSYVPLDTELEDSILIIQDLGSLPITWPVASVTTLDSKAGVWLGNATSNPTICGDNLDKNNGIILMQHDTACLGSGTLLDPIIFNSSDIQIQADLFRKKPSDTLQLAIWVDWNMNGDFNDTEDLFYNYFELPGTSQMTTNHWDIILSSLPTDTTKDLVIRALVTTSTDTLTKDDNGIFILKNGEIEDYYLQYVPPATMSMNDIILSGVVEDKSLHRLLIKVLDPKIFETLRVEYSFDLYKWHPIENITPSTINSDIHFNHVAKQDGTYFYRIVGTKADNSIDYSNTLKLSANTKDMVIVYPNPTREMLYVQYPKTQEQVEMRIYSIEGKEVYYQRFDKDALNGMQVLDLRQLPSGHYMLSILGTGTQINKMITKQ